MKNWIYTLFFKNYFKLDFMIFLPQTFRERGGKKQEKAKNVIKKFSSKNLLYQHYINIIV